VTDRCLTCGRPPAPGRVRCRSCLAKVAHAAAALRARRRRLRRCLDCGLSAPEGFRRCDACRERRNAAEALEYGVRRARGLCVDCGAKALAPGTLCRPHAERHRTANRVHKRRLAKERRTAMREIYRCRTDGCGMLVLRKHAKEHRALHAAARARKDEGPAR